MGHVRMVPGESLSNTDINIYYTVYVKENNILRQQPWDLCEYFVLQRPELESVKAKDQEELGSHFI